MSSRADKNLEYLIECVRERLDATGLCKLPGDQLTFMVQTKTSTVIDSLLNETSQDYYVKHVVTQCDWEIPFESVYLERLLKADAEKVFSAFHHLWKGLPLQHRPDLNSIFNKYIAYTMKYESVEGKYTEAHVEITKSAVSELRRYPDVIIGPWIMKLLALTYWLFTFYCEKHRRGQAYNESLHRFLSDLIVTFVLVKCLLPWHSYPVSLSTLELPDLPPFKENFFHLSISPEDAVFQRLVLKQMMEILEIKCPTPHTPLRLAQSAYEEFTRRGKWLWEKKSVDGVLRIIKDQSRYMSLRSPDLRRNYVADTTRREVSQATKELERDHLSLLMKVGEQQEAFKTFQEIMNQVDRHDDGSYLPSLPKKPTVKILKQLNVLHHFILWDVGKDILGERCPKMTDKVWFDLEGGYLGFIKFVQDLARNVIKAVATAKAAAAASTTAAAAAAAKKDVNVNRKALAKIAVSLQRIIAARWYLCEVKGKAGYIAANQKAKIHQKIVFCLLAFRTVLLYMLPQCPHPYGVQQVAVTLPDYAKRMRFNLHIQLLD